ncbi:choline dehydrogenase [Geodermatophilus sp. CPCC 205506]|uniref:choline dehydrogenase n=1 Tax=Geodermatophilus sp. CPCC 205506 TaxID=2936596 RepID=UPI003EEC58A7
MDTRYDYIVVGAGTAGCIVAARLSEDPDVEVLLVEAGGTDRLPIIAMPGALPFVYQNKYIQWGHQSGPEPELGGKVIDEKAGKVIGGSSSINAMIFNRGNPMDYDGWAADGLPDWDFARCLPYFRKMETFEDGPDDWRGGDGPLLITRARAEHKLYEAFLHAGVEAGHEVTADHNGYRQEGLHIAQSFIANGVRSSSSRAYLRPAAGRSNLHVLKRATVRRVLFENGAAVGIEVAARRGAPRRIRCAREVIVSAGAINSPRLLMLSGVGDPDELARHGIGLIAEARQVGQNLQNHPGVDIQFATDDADSLTSQIDLLGRARLGAEWLLRRQGLGTTNFFEAGAFLRGRDDVDFPNLQYEFLPLTRQLRNGRLVPVPGFQFWVDLSRPHSRGSVRLRSADPDDAPLTVFNTYSCREDLADMVRAVRQSRELVAQPSLAKYCRAELNPGPDVQTDAEIEAWIRTATGTSYHPSSTCRMGADDDAVVDSQGRVNAVTGLRVVDASIMPRVITGNLNAPVMMMAEKIADRIRGIQPAPASTAGYYRRLSSAQA